MKPLSATVLNCPLCLGSEPKLLFEDKPKQFFECPDCSLVFLHPDFHPSPEEEKKRYSLHQNSPADSGYVYFLNQLAQPLLSKITPPALGLDFGSGPSPVLADLLGKNGIEMKIYDPIYAPDKKAITRTYDVIACSETVEHFHTPAKEFELLSSLLKPGGWMGIMTKWRPYDKPFSDWFYRLDNTHVSFYRKETFEWIANVYGFKVEFPNENIALLRKRHSGE